ncbi:MAG TPA: valine--tRNA ligase [Actinobacteria bacterium]|nr:valine--tRNA ligase [Actinomycetota bacterium]
MEPTYEPAPIEDRWYAVWEDAGIFRPEFRPDGEPFAIVVPPPNVTGVLHMGHALNMSIQDAIVRRRRMQGRATLWLPGTDHAGIATQNVVERELAKEGLTRHELGRERFVERVWAWKAASGNRITEQMRRMGFSLDWTRERFTLDEQLSRAVREVFVRLYEEGLIYRGNRIINWCPRCRTALSDIEVDHEEEIGELTHLRYPLADGSGHVVVATTRPETMLGDTAVAVHPDDDRYRHLVGETVLLPLVDREIPIVADAAVDPDFGTGAVKVTPAHDPLDFEIAERHDLPAIVVIDLDGRITAEGGEFAGLDRFEAREAVRHALVERRLVERVEEHHHSVGHCGRCGTVVEPILSLQWFVSVRPLVGPAIEAVREGRTRFFPRRWEKNYFHWMENLRDWCISRQLWWGHQIPAWYCEACDETIVAVDEPTTCPRCGATELRRDEDVLDTWFSSALWPFSTLGWPEDTDDLRRFYPTDVLVTGFDIIYFWVARMMMMGLRFVDDVPFEDVVIHGLVRDAEGRKMSKSIGNVVDPLDLVERYGADAVRLALLQSAAPGHDVPLNEQWIDAARRFGNKLWNAVRFAVDHEGIADVPASGGYPEDPGPEDAWILQRLAEVAGEVDRLFDEYRFSDAFGLLYSFAWSEVFDWYIELAKSPLRDPTRAETTRRTLGIVLRDLLAFLHPAIPYVTEELWSHLGDGSLLAVAPWPSPPSVEGPGTVGIFQELVGGVRRFRSDHQVPLRTPVPLRIVDRDGVAEDWWDEQFVSLVKAEVSYGEPPDDLEGHTRIHAGPVEAFIPLAGLVDLEAERRRIAKAIAEAEETVARAEKKLADERFVAKAPPEIVEKERRKLAEARDLLDRLAEQAELLGR